MAAGNRHLGYKEMLNDLEARSPGSKAAFLFGFLERAHDRHRTAATARRDDGVELRSVPDAAVHRPRARCARSAACASGRSR